MQADKARNQQLWGSALVVVGLALQVLFFFNLAHSESDDRTLDLLPAGSLLCMIGLGIAARAKGRTVWWFLLGGGLADSRANPKTMLLNRKAQLSEQTAEL